MSDKKDVNKEVITNNLDESVREKVNKVSKSSEALNKLNKNKKPVKTNKKKRTFKEKTIAFVTNFDNYKTFLIFLIIGFILIIAGIKIQIGRIEDSDSIMIGTIIRSVLIAIGSGIIVGGFFKQRRRW